MTIGEITVIVAYLFAAFAFLGAVWWKRKSLGKALAEFQYPLMGVSGPLPPVKLATSCAQPRQYCGDMVCGYCGVAWDAGDEAPPCRGAEEALKRGSLF